MNFIDQRKRKKRAEKAGRWAEALAIVWFCLFGYSILAHRWRGRSGEIDLIVSRRRTLVFVEVKLRATLDSARESITPFQRRRVRAAAEEWLALQASPSFTSIRFDCFFLVPWSYPRHVKDAF